MKEMTYKIIGTGVLSWESVERISDRYGFVFLIDNADNKEALPFDSALILSQSGLKGTLKAFIIETRDSRHIGDLFRHIYPKTPPIGEEIELGKGTLAFRDDINVGLEPTDGRESGWLDPHALYQCHEQTVELRFYPEI